MDTLLFSSRSIWTMVHGVFLGAGALTLVAASLFALIAMRSTTGPAADMEARFVGWLLVASAALVWLAVVIGTYVSFPPYRATPPEGLLDLSQYPRALIRSNPATACLHSFAMETKEHVPWIAAMLTTAVAFVALRYRSRFLTGTHLRRMGIGLLAISFILIAGAALLGILINKVAPLE